MFDNSKTLQMEIFSMVILLLIPWHGPLTPRPHCPREKASLVRKVVTKKWVPILEKVGAALPLDCPLHPARDIFKLHDSRKRHYSPQWTCGFCGKSFYHESNLDAHMELRHADKLNTGEDTICVADFCDVMRCEVLHERLQELEELTPTATALDIWHKPLLIASKRFNYHGDQAVERALPRNLMRTTPKSSWTREQTSGTYPSSISSSTGFSEKPLPPYSPDPSSLEPPMSRKEVKKSKTSALCSKEDKLCETKSKLQNKTQPESPDIGEPPEVPIQPLHSWRDTCNEENLAELRVKCQQLVQQCVSGLVLNLTMEQVRDVEGAFHRAVCWYLTCERYWEAGTMEPPEFPWGVVSALIFLLTFGVSMCYYIVWVLCESVTESAANTPVTSDPPSKVPQVACSSSKALNSSLTVSGGGGCSSRGNSLGRPGGASASRARFSTTESESECRDSGFNEGALYPEYDSQELPGDVNSYRSRHYSEDSRLSLPAEESNPRYYSPEERVYNYASTFTPNYEQRRLRRNRYNYLDDFDAYAQIDGDNLDANGGLSRERSDSFIYVSYPPEVKKRFQENNR